MVNQKKWHNKNNIWRHMGFLRNGCNNSLLQFCSIYTKRSKHRAENVIVDIHKCTVLAEHLLYVKHNFLWWKNIYIMEWDRNNTCSFISCILEVWDIIYNKQINDQHIWNRKSATNKIKHKLMIKSD